MILTAIESLVFEALKESTKDNPITRRQLRDVTKLDERGSREIIGRLRDKGLRIANGSKGYWYAKDNAEYSAWVNSYVSYATTILRRKKAMDDFTEGQIEIGQV